MTVPDEMIEAARIDGAGPLRFLWDILIPLSRTNIAALFVILFIYGWNQYLWPLMVSTDVRYQTIVLALGRMMLAPEAAYEWPIIMSTAVLALRSEEHTSELQSLMRISYAVFCLKKKTQK